VRREVFLVEIWRVRGRQDIAERMYRITGWEGCVSGFCWTLCGWVVDGWMRTVEGMVGGWLRAMQGIWGIWEWLGIVEWMWAAAVA
jgi:hypothetical protein